MVRQQLRALDPSVAYTARPKLWLVRHAQPCIAPGVCYGMTDVAAAAPSTQDAAVALAQVLPQGARMLCSPLQRCELLAQALQGLRPDLTYTLDPRLAEMNFGCHEGQRWDSIDRAAFDAWTADFWHHRFGGVQSVAEFMAQVQGVWDEAMRTGTDQVWITHAGVIRAASLLALGVRRVDDAHAWPQTAPEFGHWHVISLPVS